jgi:hypothetical protein
MRIENAIRYMFLSGGSSPKLAHCTALQGRAPENGGMLVAPLVLAAAC